MSELRVITNHVPRDVIHEFELTLKEQAQFDYLDWPAMERGEDSASFFRYRGQLYDLGEFMRCSGPFADVRPVLAKWDGYAADSFFSATMVRYVEDGERVIVGTVLS